jgi:hypothetical protein
MQSGGLFARAGYDYTARTIDNRAGRVESGPRMKDSKNTAQLLDLPYAPEADALLDELERSGQFRVGLDAENDEPADGDAPSSDYSWGRGSGNVVIQDWWTTGRVALRVGPGLAPGDIVLTRVDDSLVVRTHDGLDRVTIESYLGLIPDASTLQVIFSEGTTWTGEQVLAHIGTRISQVGAAPGASSH